MLKKELVNKFGIINWFSRKDPLDDLYSCSTDRDPSLIAESHGFDCSEGKPFHVSVFIGKGICETYLFIFKDYRAKVKFVSEELVVKLV